MDNDTNGESAAELNDSAEESTPAGNAPQGWNDFGSVNSSFWTVNFHFLTCRMQFTMCEINEK